MSGMLASVRSLEEAQIVTNFAIDILDLKEPALGALGAVDQQTIESVVAMKTRQSLVSATIGDIPCTDVDKVIDQIKLTALTGVDFVKIGWFEPVETQMQRSARQLYLKKYNACDQVKKIIVLFADQLPDMSIVEDIAEAGFHGVMLDTAEKKRGSLTEILTFDQIREFISMAKSCNLITGLAGSLRADDISILKPLSAEYLGFRGALCAQHQREAKLDPNAVEIIRQKLKQEEQGYGEVA